MLFFSVDRFAILPPLFGILVHGAVSYLVIRTDSSVAVLLVGEFLYGFSGSLHTITVTCLAYVAERTPAERRMLRITLLQLCVLVAGMSTAIAVGPVVDGVGAANSVLIAFSISLVNFAYVYCFLRNDDRKVGRESVADDDRSNGLADSRVSNNEDGIDTFIGSDDSRVTQPVAGLDSSGYSTDKTDSGGGYERSPGLPRLRHVSPRSSNSETDDNRQPESKKSRVELLTRQLCSGFRRVVSLFASPGPHRVRLNILTAAFVFSVLPTFDHSLQHLFEMNQPLCWGVRDIGVFTGVTLAVSALGAVVVTPTMKKCATDWHIAMTASVAAVITNVYKFFVRNSVMMYICKFISFLFLMFGILTVLLTVAVITLQNYSRFYRGIQEY